ncbi:unnamed protein product [Meganyctiphanes norvegica]|uniref:Uncharacterized protein n=1 Tax=Meganyctiphanes norvegica TaxID=48144 RepID=A0AAV2S5C9_MEGNR
MTGPHMKLAVDPNATPVARHKAIPVAIHYQEQVKANLDMDCRIGVLGKVPPGTPTTWCSPIIVCPKGDGKPRRTVDFQSLNKHASRETHHTPSPFHLARSVPPSRKKTTLDFCWNGYHSGAFRQKVTLRVIFEITKCNHESLLADFCIYLCL